MSPNVAVFLQHALLTTCCMWFGNYTGTEHTNILFRKRKTETCQRAVQKAAIEDRPRYFLFLFPPPFAVRVPCKTRAGARMDICGHQHVYGGNMRLSKAVLPARKYIAPGPSLTRCGETGIAPCSLCRTRKRRLLVIVNPSELMSARCMNRVGMAARKSRVNYSSRTQK